MRGPGLGPVLVGGADGAGAGTVRSAVTVVLPQTGTKSMSRLGTSIGWGKRTPPTHTHLLLPEVLHPADERQVEAHPEAVLEEKRRPAAVQPPFGDDGDAVAQEVSLVHVMGGEDDGPTCTGAQPRLSRAHHRGHGVITEPNQSFLFDLA